MDASTLTTPLSVPSFGLLDGTTWDAVELSAGDSLTVHLDTGTCSFMRSDLPLFVRIAEDETVSENLRIGAKDFSLEDAKAIAQEIADRFNLSISVVGLSSDCVVYRVTDPHARPKEERHGS